MNIAFVGELALKSLVLVLVVALATSLLRKASAAVRHGVWALGFVGLALLPLLLSGLPTLEIERPDPITTPPMTVAPATTHLVLPNEPVGQPVPKAASSEPAPGFPWPSVLAWVWAAGVLSILLRMAFTLAQAERIARRGERLEAAQGVRVWRTGEVDVPMTYGLLRPTILLPQVSRDWSEERLRTVLLHEEAHIGRKDWAWLIFARIVRAFYWPNPLVGWAESRLRAECEMAADDAVVMAGVSASRYAEDLVEIAAEVRSGQRVAYALSIVEKATLKSRVREILRRAKSRRPLTLRVAAVVLVVGLAGVLPFAAARFVQGLPTVSNGNFDMGNGRQLSIVAITDTMERRPACGTCAASCFPSPGR
ncbi:hypothetical protein BH11ARM2_BH11ARM2_27990 [soil metagenome]